MKQVLRVTRSTMDRLKSLSAFDGESYDSILNRLLDGKLGDMRITYQIVDVLTSVSVFVVVDYDELYPNYEYFVDLNYRVDDTLNVLCAWFFFKLEGSDFFSFLPLLDPYEFVLVDEFLVCRYE